MIAAITYRIAINNKDYGQAKELFQEYVRSLNVDLSFQSFDRELTTIHEQYGQPNGSLLVAYDGDTAIGCVGIRRLNDEIAELKRMYVKPGYRGRKIGVQLLQQSIGLARTLSYKKIRLDTLATMHTAQSLYLSFGFITIPPYRFNPIPGTIYMERNL